MRAARTLQTLLVCAPAILPACGGDDEVAPPTATPSPAATSVVPEPVGRSIDQSVWFAGFEVTFGDAAFEPEGELGPTVTIDALFENAGGDTYAFDGTVVLSSAGISFETSALETTVPSVPGGGTGEGVYAFTVDEDFTFDDAVLTIGRPENHQAVVPLGTEGELLDLEPVSLSISGRTKAGEIVVKIAGGELRADVPETHTQAEAGMLFLTLRFDLSYVGDFPGGFPFGYANSLALELPDGITIAADDGPIELLSPGTTLPDQTVRFTVDAPSAGSYQLVVTDTEHAKKNGLEFDIV